MFKKSIAPVIYKKSMVVVNKSMPLEKVGV